LASAEGGEPQQLTEGPSVGNPRWSFDGREIYFVRDTNLWVVSVEDRTERRLTDLVGRQGDVGPSATDGEYLYFSWEEDVGDLWVMDVAN
jgi:Tol biopolymer transport system component